MKRIINLLKGKGIYAAVILLTLSSCKKEDQNQLPWIQIISPLSNTNIESGDSIEIIAEAGDADGSISKVLFYIDEALVLQDQQPLISFNGIRFLRVIILLQYARLTIKTGKVLYENLICEQ